VDARSIIAAVRRKETPSSEALSWFANGLASGDVSDAQALTQGMRDSGDVLRWDLPGPVLDKHSTGGVGDCVSLVLAPALAACGVYVPMISGRGLGHTGGTLDKLEAIPGVSTSVDEARLRLIVEKIGCAIVGATGRIAPADKRLYAIRDVTATVESVDLITASILSKKLAAGLEGLVLDVKVGSGAFMKTADEAGALARALVDAANGARCRTAALITDMNQPLAPTLGNAVEVATCMEVLSGNRAAAPRLHDLVVALGARLLALHGETEDAAAKRLTRAISSGQAMQRFAAMIAALGGPPDMAEDWHTHLPRAPIVGDVTAPKTGQVTAIDGQALGMAVVALGGGRRVETDRIDPAVGLTDVVSLGDVVTVGQPLCTLHGATEDAAEEAAQAVRAAITIGDAPRPHPLIVERIS